MLRQLAAFGAPEEILHRAKPHIGTDRLRQVVRNLREEILRLGGEIRFDTRLEELEIAGGRVVSCTAGGEKIPCSRLVLAVGHSARDTFALLLDKGLPVEPKPFSVGVRIEHLQAEIDRGLYGDAGRGIPPCRWGSTSSPAGWASRGSTPSACARGERWSPPPPRRAAWWSTA